MYYSLNYELLQIFLYSWEVLAETINYVVFYGSEEKTTALAMLKVTVYCRMLSFTLWKMFMDSESSCHHLNQPVDYFTEYSIILTM